jgi:4-hydroxy-tetrahydrodipicolinate synthase
LEDDMFVPKGIIPPLITPIDEAERLDAPGLRRLIEHVIAGGVHGVFVLGSTGEFYGVEFADKKRAVEVTIDQVRRRVPVYVGASAITTRECIQLVKLAKQAGADAVSVLTPMFISPSDDELYIHFRTIAEAEDIPVLLYNNPDRTGVNISAALMERLAAIPNIVGAKDSSGDMTLTSEYIRRTQGMGFHVLAGRDTLILATLVYGGTGAVAATANVVPELVVDIYRKFASGDVAGALAAQYRLAPLRIAFGLGTFPVVTKDALNILGVDVGHPIRPVHHLSEANRQRLRGILEEIRERNRGAVSGTQE